MHLHTSSSRSRTYRPRQPREFESDVKALTPVAFWCPALGKDGLDGLAAEHFLQSSRNEVEFRRCVGHVGQGK